MDDTSDGMLFSVVLIMCKYMCEDRGNIMSDKKITMTNHTTVMCQSPNSRNIMFIFSIILVPKGVDIVLCLSKFILSQMKFGMDVTIIDVFQDCLVDLSK